MSWRLCCATCRQWFPSETAPILDDPKFVCDECRATIAEVEQDEGMHGYLSYLNDLAAKPKEDLTAPERVWLQSGIDNCIRLMQPNPFIEDAFKPKPPDLAARYELEDKAKRKAAKRNWRRDPL